MDSKLAEVYYSPRGYWKGTAAIKNLAETAKVPEDTAKRWLIKQALWQVYLPAPSYVPRPKFDVPTPNTVHQADLLFDHTTNRSADAKFTNTRLPWSTWPAATKKPSR